METEGVMVVTTAQIPTNLETLSSPCEGSLQQGDYITSINGNPVNSKEELVSSVEACAGQPLTLHIVREQESFDISVLPIQDTSGTYRLGVWVKDDVQGIGTLTYKVRMVISVRLVIQLTTATQEKELVCERAVYMNHRFR